MRTNELMRLEREYRRERAAILEDPELSWEKKMRAVLELFNRYRARQEDGGRKAEKMRAIPAILRICAIPNGLSRPTCRW